MAYEFNRDKHVQHSRGGLNARHAASGSTIAIASGGRRAVNRIDSSASTSPQPARAVPPRTGPSSPHARDDVFLYSAALAFYGLISVAPLVIVALWVTSLVVGPTQVHHVADELGRLAPPALGADQALERVAHLRTALGVVAVVAALWPATAYGAALVRVLDRVAGDREATGLRGRGAALLLVAPYPSSCSAA